MSFINKFAITNIIKVSLSNIIKLAGGIFVGFLLPKIIGITDYGYYKTFTLYASYLGIFSFGFMEGIYLKYGGISYDEINKEKFRLYTRFFVFLELVLGVAMALISLFFLTNESKIIFLFLAIFLLFNNIISYYQIISQVTCRFRELSFRNIIQSTLTILGVIIIYFIDKYLEINYIIYLIIYVSTSGIMAVWYCCTYRELFLGKSIPLSAEKSNILYFFRLGFPLLIASICSTLILSVDRQFVNVLFDTDTYAVYAFAYNMLTLITTTLAAISTVVYPLMKKANAEELVEKYDKMIAIVAVLSTISLMVYFPLVWFVGWFLPKYTDSLLIFRIILPGVAIQSSINLIMHNYYKTFGKELLFFVKCIIVLALSIVANCVAYRIYKTPASISMASMIVMLIWYIIIEEYFVRKYGIKWVRNLLYISTMSIIFYCVTIINIWWLALVLYILVFIVLSLLFYCDYIKKIVNSIKNKNEN